MNKYDTLLNILDNICNTAPDNFKSYCLQEKSEDEKNQIRSKAFIHLYLLVKFGLEDFKSRHDLITDGIADGGLDAYFIDAETKYIYLFQSKFRTNSQNFENKDISVDELMAMEIDRIVEGKIESEDGNTYNRKIQGFQKKLSDICDLPRYKYKIIILANLKSDKLLNKLFGSYERDIFNYERTYKELVFPMCSSTYYKNENIVVKMEVEGKIEEVTETFATSFGNCNVTLLFVPIINIAQIINKYKNSILEFNPRNYLSMSKNPVNKGIKESACESNCDFTLLNNGITMICSQYESTTRTGKSNTTKITIDNPQILNGGQTAYTLSKILDTEENCFEKMQGKKVLLKVISIYKDDQSEKDYRTFVNKISDATNKQTKIDEADRRANNEIQVKLQNDIYEKYGLYYERKAGEFEEALSKGLIYKDMIIKRDVLLKTLWAYNGKCGEARNYSGDKIFNKDVFDEIMQGNVTAEITIYSYRIHKELMELDKLYKKQDYNSSEWGGAIRYGKFAVISAYAILFPCLDLEDDEEVLRENTKKVLEMWKKFEEFVREREENKRYFCNQDEFVNYYKSSNVDKDVADYFRQFIL
ncbi:MAG: AIPR family protein [Lachnospiraceae bacterium]